MPHKKFMKEAIQKAIAGVRKGQTPFGACIVKNEKIISCAHNVVWHTTDITAHAEIHAIRLACRKLKTIDLSGCTIYSTCEPCPMCFSACHWAKISKIIYGVSIANAKKIGFNELFVSNKIMKRIGRSPVEIQSSFLRKECLETFKLWAKHSRKRVY